MMDLKEKYDVLRDSFEPEAYSTDNSRGFTLTSIKAAYVIERLNDVFGLCGYGWRYAHAPFEEIPSGSKTEIVTIVALQYRLDDEDAGAGLVMWNAVDNGWEFITAKRGWSVPIFAAGGKNVVKGNLTDARKSAITDGITKAASILGVGDAVFKGLVDAKSPQQGERKAQGQREPKEPMTLEMAIKMSTKKGKSFRDLKQDELALVVKNANAPDVGPLRAEAAEVMLKFLAEQGGPTIPDATYNSLTA